jgi:hypothetical protein
MYRSVASDGKIRGTTMHGYNKSTNTRREYPEVSERVRDSDAFRGGV